MISAARDSGRRAVITGMGLVSCLGLTLDEVASSLQEGRSGIRVIPERQALGFRSPLSGVLPPFDVKDYMKRKDRKGLSEAASYVSAAVLKAVEHSGGDFRLFDSERAGIIVGNDSSSDQSIYMLDTVRSEQKTTTLGSSLVLKSMTSSPTINLTPFLKIKGLSLTISAACASGAHSTGLAYMMIKSGFLDVVLAGGCQELNWQSMASFDALMTFSVRTDEPEKASRPFDRERDGLIPSGGGAALVLEDLDHARKRGAQIIAEVVGYGFSSDGTHVTNPDGVGAERCIRMALEQARMAPEDVDYINAHATGTLVGDYAEALAIHSIFNECKTPVSSTKSMTGHECWMAGASELIYSILMMQKDFIAPNINFTAQGENEPPINVVPVTREQPLEVVLSNSFGFGGTNASLILSKFHG